MPNEDEELTLEEREAFEEAGRAQMRRLLADEAALFFVPPPLPEPPRTRKAPLGPPRAARRR